MIIWVFSAYLLKNQIAFTTKEYIIIVIMD